MQKPDPASTPKPRGRPRIAATEPEAVTVQALDRAMLALSILAEDKGPDADTGMTLSDLAERCGLPAATVYRALMTLQVHQMVEVSEPGQIWHVGVGAFRIGAAFARRNALVERGRPKMQALQRISGETAVLARQDAGEILVLAQAEPEAGIRASYPPGARGEMHAMALGKVILAWSPETEARRILAERGMAKATSLTITSETSLMRDLARTRERGYALDDQESADGLRSIAAPIFNADGEVLAALAIVGPAFRFGLSSVNKVVAELRDAADQITLSTGGRLPA